MVAHKAAFDAREVECLVILVFVIFGAEVLIPVAGHILLDCNHISRIDRDLFANAKLPEYIPQHLFGVDFSNNGTQMI